MASPDDLLSMFAQMGTTDHGELINQFCQVLPGAEPEAAQFFLECNNWGLQEAISSFFDNGGASVLQQQRLPQAEFVCDVTIGEGEEIPPGTQFEKTWRLRNSGNDPWPSEVALQYVGGEKMAGPEFVQVPSLAPGEVADVSVHLRSPTDVGRYAASWRLCCNNSGSTCFFGEQIWVVIDVAVGGTLPILQQLHHTSIEQSGQYDESMLGAGDSGPSLPGMNFQSGFGGDSSMFQGPPQPTSFGSLSEHTFGSSSQFSSRFGEGMEDNVQPLGRMGGFGLGNDQSNDGMNS